MTIDLNAIRNAPDMASARRVTRGHQAEKPRDPAELKSWMVADPPPEAPLPDDREGCEIVFTAATRVKQPFRFEDVYPRVNRKPGVCKWWLKQLIASGHIVEALAEEQGSSASERRANAKRMVGTNPRAAPASVGSG
jgi:hypothetical protein